MLARRYELPDVLVQPMPTREYPGAPIMASHVFGYVGEVNEAQVAASEDLKSGDIVGQSGIERIYNALLMGEDGAKRVVVNSIGREIRVDEKIDPTEGKRIQLTIDADVQRSIENGFRALGFIGAAVLHLLQTFTNQYTPYWPTVLGLILLVIVMVLPDGLIGLAAHVHMAATLPQNYIAFEYPFGQPDWWYDIVEGLPNPIVKNGFIDVWDRPGLGVTFKVAAAKARLTEQDRGFFD